MTTATSGSTCRWGDKVEVRCKEISNPDGYIFWEAVNKQHRSRPLDYDYEPDTIVLGTVVRVADFGRSTGVFVNLQLGIDALCPMPRDLEIEENSRVSIKIESVSPGKRPTDPPRIRGPDHPGVLIFAAAGPFPSGRAYSRSKLAKYMARNLPNFSSVRVVRFPSRSNLDM